MSYLKYLSACENEMIKMLKTFVEYETPSNDKASVDRFSSYLFELLRDIGMDAEILPQNNVGNNLKATFGKNEKGQILILCHMDTVWPLHEIEKRPFHINDGKAYGPGVLDMKGGLVQAIFAIKALMNEETEPTHKIVLFCSSDEEIGSCAAHEAIEREAKKSSFVLVPEPAAGDNGALKLSRKGWGMYKIHAMGRAAHSGNDHINGINAVEELAYHVIELQKLTDYKKGTTINVGEFQGGSGYNIVPDHAVAKIDLRAATMAELTKANNTIMGLQPVLKNASLKITGGINRPPLELTPGNKQLYEHAQKAALKLGFTALTGIPVGGASDGNYTSYLGIPTLDGIGSVGSGGHSLNEHVLLNKMAERSALLAELLDKSID